MGGLRCLTLGADTITSSTHNCTTAGIAGMAGMTCDDCQGAAWPVALYLILNFGYNVVMVLVLQKADAGMLFAMSTLTMPIRSLAFSSTLLMGAEHAEPVETPMIIGGACILVGVAAYNHWSGKGGGKGKTE